MSNLDKIKNETLKDIHYICEYLKNQLTDNGTCTFKAEGSVENLETGQKTDCLIFNIFDKQKGHFQITISSLNK